MKIMLPYVLKNMMLFLKVALAIDLENEDDELNEETETTEEFNLFKVINSVRSKNCSCLDSQAAIHCSSYYRNFLSQIEKITQWTSMNPSPKVNI